MKIACTFHQGELYEKGQGAYGVLSRHASDVPLLLFCQGSHHDLGTCISKIGQVHIPFFFLLRKINIVFLRLVRQQFLALPPFRRHFFCFGPQPHQRDVHQTPPQDADLDVGPQDHAEGEEGDAVVGGAHLFSQRPYPLVHEVDGDHDQDAPEEHFGYVGDERKRQQDHEDFGESRDESRRAGADPGAQGHDGLAEDVAAGVAAQETGEDVAGADGLELVVEVEGVAQFQFDGGDV
mmetsp:Transcript_29255/g.67184  ORF Transcript_29255/g.67184 Transcript_29255/m.67184 type:complete len:236 (+) Transcript_29255:155-862(+)